MKLPRIKISLIRFNFIKLPIRCIPILTAIPSREVSLRSSSNFENCWNCINFTAFALQINFSHIIRFQVASYSACYLANGDYMRYLLEKLEWENIVIAAVKKWKCFQFQMKYWKLHCNHTEIFPCTFVNFPCFVKKSSLNISMQQLKSSSNLD